MPASSFNALSVPVPVLPLRPVGATSAESNCSGCNVRSQCLPCGMEGGEVRRLDSLMFNRRRIKAGQSVYRAGDPFKFIYAVRSGTLKTSLETADGREQVSGFYLGGELMGLDGLADGRYASSATALEDAEVCAIPFADLTAASPANARMQHAVNRIMSHEIVREHSLMLLLGSMNADERLAAFLINLSQRLKARGFSPSEFHLRMSRAEIGSYLGMTVETVSRTFSALQQQGMVTVAKRHVRIMDIGRLCTCIESRLH